MYLHTQVLEGQQCHGRLPNSRMTFSATSLTGHMSVFRGNRLVSKETLLIGHQFQVVTLEFLIGILCLHQY